MSEDCDHKEFKERLKEIIEAYDNNDVKKVAYRMLNNDTSVEWWKKTSLKNRCKALFLGGFFCKDMWITDTSQDWIKNIKESASHDNLKSLLPTGKMRGYETVAGWVYQNIHSNWDLKDQEEEFYSQNEVDVSGIDLNKLFD